MQLGLDATNDIVRDPMVTISDKNLAFAEQAKNGPLERRLKKEASGFVAKPTKATDASWSLDNLARSC